MGSARMNSNPFFNTSVPINIEAKLFDIFNFLKQNREYNLKVHSLDYQNSLIPFTSKHDKIVSLLHSTVNTQSQPKLDKLRDFFKELNSKARIQTFEDLINVLHELKSKPNYKKTRLEFSFQGLFHILRVKSGWGDKTAALFAKALYKLQNTSQFPENFKVFNKSISHKDDKLYLPVDAVIEHIFLKELKIEGINGFNKINNLLHNKYSNEEMEIWDDLWFWGFITQKTENGKRTTEFNEAKLWSLIAILKDSNNLIEIENKSKEFIMKLKN